MELAKSPVEVSGIKDSDDPNKLVKIEQEKELQRQMTLIVVSTLLIIIMIIACLLLIFLRLNKKPYYHN